MRYTETTKDDSAVSPVIGVILMVAITVILAAVIGTFVLGLGSNVQETPQAGIQFSYDQGENNVTVSVTDPGNVDALYFVNASGDMTNASDSPAVFADPSAGDRMTLPVGDGNPIDVLGQISGQNTTMQTYEGHL